MTKKFLSYYLIIGIITSMTIISIWAINEGRMMPFYILFAGLLFLPFALVSSFSLLDIIKHKKTIQGGIWTGTTIILIASCFLPFFYEWGGLIIALVSTGIGFIIWAKRKDIESQILILNVIGSIILTLIWILLFISWNN